MNIQVKNEKLFCHFAQSELDELHEIRKLRGECPEIIKNIQPTDLGRSQFVLHQSNGVAPSNPDPYYNFLTRGKWGFDFITRELEQAYTKALENENSMLWDDFALIWEDWKGNRWILPYILSWYPKLTGRELPTWIASEELTSEKFTQIQKKN